MWDKVVLFLGPFYKPIFRLMVEKDMGLYCLVDIETCLYLCDVSDMKVVFFRLALELKFNPFPRLFDL